MLGTLRAKSVIHVGYLKFPRHMDSFFFNLLKGGRVILPISVFFFSTEFVMFLSVYVPLSNLICININHACVT